MKNDPNSSAKNSTSHLQGLQAIFDLIHNPSSEEKDLERAEWALVKEAARGKMGPKVKTERDLNLTVDMIRLTTGESIHSIYPLPNESRHLEFISPTES